MKKILTMVILFAVFVSFSMQNGSLISVSTDEFENYIKKYGTNQLLDVRTPQEFNAGHIPGAKLANIYDSDFKNKIKSFNFTKSKPILIYCRSGNRSLVGGKYLSEQGYQVINLKYGIKDWIAKNKPVEK
jgi:rhodanese-related sulfurtransferase